MDYLRDLGLGSHIVTQVKLFVVGNRCAGKTTLLHTLRKGFLARLMSRDPGNSEVERVFCIRIQFLVVLAQISFKILRWYGMSGLQQQRPA